MLAPGSELFPASDSVLENVTRLTHKCFIQKMFKVIKHYLHLDFTKTVKRESWSVFRRRNCSSTSFSENVPLQFRGSQVLLWLPLWTFVHPPGVSWALVFHVLPSACVGSVWNQCCWSDNDLLSVQTWAGWPCSLGNCSLLCVCGGVWGWVLYDSLPVWLHCHSLFTEQNQFCFPRLCFTQPWACVLCVCGLSDGPPSSRGQVVS